MRRLPTSLLILALFVSAISVPSCATAEKSAIEAATDTTLPHVADAVKTDAKAGISLIAVDDPEFDKDLAALRTDWFFDATSSGERPRVAAALPHWPTVRGYAERGYEIEIRKGTMGAGVAASLIERLDNFERLITEVSTGVMPTGDRPPDDEE